MLEEDSWRIFLTNQWADRNPIVLKSRRMLNLLLSVLNLVFFLFLFLLSSSAALYYTNNNATQKQSEEQAIFENIAGQLGRFYRKRRSEDELMTCTSKMTMTIVLCCKAIDDFKWFFNSKSDNESVRYPSW